MKRNETKQDNYLTDEQLEQFRSILLQKRSEVIAQAQEKLQTKNMQLAADELKELSRSLQNHASVENIQFSC